MTWTENEFSSCVKSMRGSLSDINNFEKRSSSREDSSSSFNTNPEQKSYMQHLIARNNESKLKHFGDLMKMQTVCHSTKNFLKRSQSSNAGSCAASDFKSICFRSKNLDAITSQHDFSSRFEDVETQCIDIENASRGSYRDDAISTNSESSPLLPLHGPSCHEAHENELFISCSSSSLISNKSVKVLANLDSLSICDDEEDIPPRISMMNDLDKRKTKSVAKSLYNVKTCSESDNKELNAAIQIAQNASTCLSGNKKLGQSRFASGKLSRWKVNHNKEDRKTFSEDSRLLEDYHSTPNEQLTYNELISKPTSSYGKVFAQDIQRDRVNSLGHVRCRQHSSLSDSENLLNLTRDHVKECLLTSRSDGTEVPLFEEKLFAHNCPKIIPACRHKSYPSGMGSSHAPKQFPTSKSVTTSSRSLPTSLESNSLTFLLERQISTPLPNTSMVSLSELDEPDKVPPLPEKRGSRSNLSISDSKNQKNLNPVKPLFYHSHPSSIKDNISTTTNQFQPDQLLLSAFSQEETANNFGAIQSEHLPSAHNAITTIDPASPPPLPSRTFIHCNAKSIKGPPLPPKGAVSQTLPHRHPHGKLPFQRPSSEESDNLEESSSSSGSSNFASSIDSDGLEQYSENSACICKQLARVDISKNSIPPPFFLHSDPGHSTSQGDELLEEACAPMPGRYETSDSLVYDYFESPPLNMCYRECHHITEKVRVLKKHFPGVSTNDLECALIENNYNVEEVIKHLTVKSALAPSSRYNTSDMTSCVIPRHGQHFVPDPMEA